LFNRFECATVSAVIQAPPGPWGFNDHVPICLSRPTDERVPACCGHTLAKLNMGPMTGAEVDALLGKLYALPPDVVAKASKAIVE
jgi:hypothetical protein